MEDLFSQNEVVFFDGLEDMEEKTRFFIDNASEARKIAKAGYLAAHDRFNNKDVTAEMIAKIYAD
jgi:spore maturation protein CgeB